MSVETEAPRTGAQVAESLATDPGQRKVLRQYAQAKFGIRDQDSEDLIQETMIQLMQTRDLVLRPGGFVLRVFHSRCCDHLRRQKLRIGARDLKIAATALVNQALLLSANRTDFKSVSSLRVENWLD